MLQREADLNCRLVWSFAAGAVPAIRVKQAASKFRFSCRRESLDSLTAFPHGQIIAQVSRLALGGRSPSDRAVWRKANAMLLNMFAR